MTYYEHKERKPREDEQLEAARAAKLEKMTPEERAKAEAAYAAEKAADEKIIYQVEVEAKKEQDKLNAEKAKESHAKA